MHRFRRVLPALLLLLCLWQIGLPAQAQTNLLVNPNFESPYGGIGTANGWDGGSVKTPHTETWMNIDAIFTAQRATVYEGTLSQEMGRSGGTFTAAVWQKVDNIQAGTRLRFNVWVYIANDASANARVRVGIDSNNVGSPMDDMTWSSYLTTVNSWQQLTVEATVPAGYVTVYVFGTQDWPKATNSVFMDQASLTVVGTGQPVTQPTAASGSTSVPVVVVPTTPPQVYAPSVSRQDQDASDGIIHTVQSGDTLAAIAVAYGTTVTKIVELNGIDRHAVLALGQKLIIQPPGAAPAPTTAPSSSGAQPTTAPGGSAAQPTTAPSTSAAQPTTASGGSGAQPTTSGSALNTILGTTTAAAPATTEEAAATDAPAQPTEAPTATPTTEATSTSAPTWTPTDVPPTSTVEGTSVANAVTSQEAGVCVTLFEDTNKDRFQQDDEKALAGGLIALRDLQGKEVASYETTSDSKPYCFTGISPITYNLVVTPPDGYGLTTTSSLTVNAQVGTQFQVNIGAAKGVQPPATPTLNSTVAQTLPDADVTSPSSGTLVLIFVGLIAVVAIGAGVLIFVIRRL